MRHFRHDLPLRWSASDLAEQQAFATQNIAAGDWLDWSSDTAAMDLVQAAMGQPFYPQPGVFGSILLASPVAEMIPPELLFSSAARQLGPGKRLVAILPCVRDNSPESWLFCRQAEKLFWPYHPAEELLETLRDAGWEPDPEQSRFHPVTPFKTAVLADKLGFKGFRRVFDQLEAEGYDPMEIGWGELRVVATRAEE
ncbi:MAG TPA: hypothetical protein VHH73_16080 [Verrucomicrobiae bacterium]|nr:hypothetical protein [Verrucomicrobiae bacterium]